MRSAAEKELNVPARTVGVVLGVLCTLAAEHMESFLLTIKASKSSESIYCSPATMVLLQLDGDTISLNMVVVVAIIVSPLLVGEAVLLLLLPPS